jgi:hypothetical protein
MSISPRIRSRFHTIPDTFYNRVTGFSDQVVPFTHWKEYEWFLDQINPKDYHTGHRAPGPAQHLRVTRIYELPSWSWTSPDDRTISQTNMSGAYEIGYSSVRSFLQGESGWYYGQSPTGSADAADLGFSNMIGEFSKTAAFSGLCVAAFNKFATQMPTQVSILNFLYELKDFKETAKALSKIPKALKDGSLSKLVTSPIRKKKGKFRQVPKAINDSLLSYNFQWAPFVGDIVKLINLGDSITKRLDFLRKTRGKEVTIRFSKPDAYAHPQLGQVILDNSLSSDWQNRFVLDTYQCNFVATCKLYQNLEGLDDMWTGLRATFAALGVNNLGKVVWNAIPFSFLLDWVLPLGNWLDRYAVQPFQGQWDVYDCTTSVHEVGMIHYYVWPKFKGNPPALMSKTKVERYLRLVGLPTTLTGVDFSQLTDNQQRLFLSLGLAKIL